MSKTISPRQLAANRANALRSTGPRTPRGKAISAQNARKHGLAASSPPAPVLEGFDDFAELRAGLVALYKPANCQELYAIERIAVAQQHLLRAARLESGLFSACLLHAGDNLPGFDHPGIEMTPGQRQNLALAEGFHHMAGSSPTWRLFLRYQAQNERLYRRAIEDFDRLKSLRGEFAEIPNEPVFHPQPQRPEAVSAPPAEPDPPLPPTWDAGLATPPAQPSSAASPQCDRLGDAPGPTSHTLPCDASSGSPPPPGEIWRKSFRGISGSASA